MCVFGRDFLQKSQGQRFVLYWVDACLSLGIFRRGYGVNPRRNLSGRARGNPSMFLFTRYGNRGLDLIQNNAT